jgi:hypothetical protein
LVAGFAESWAATAIGISATHTNARTGHKDFKVREYIDESSAIKLKMLKEAAFYERRFRFIKSKSQSEWSEKERNSTFKRTIRGIPHSMVFERVALSITPGKSRRKTNYHGNS